MNKQHALWLWRNLCTNSTDDSLSNFGYVALAHNSSVFFGHADEETAACRFLRKWAQRIEEADAAAFQLWSALCEDEAGLLPLGAVALSHRLSTLLHDSCDDCGPCSISVAEWLRTFADSLEGKE